MDAVREAGVGPQAGWDQARLSPRTPSAPSLALGHDAGQGFLSALLSKAYLDPGPVFSTVTAE